MLQVSVGCLFIGLGALILGFFQVGDISFEGGRMAFLIFLSLAVLTFLSGLTFEKSSK
jgi:hypothetical protein